MLGLLSSPAFVFVFFGLPSFAAFNEGNCPSTSFAAVHRGLVAFPAVCAGVGGRPGVAACNKGSGAAAYALSVERGRVAFAEEGAACHGRLAEGTERGPNLIHPDYGRRVRSDAQLRRAVREGMPARLGYGAMPPSPDVSARRLERMITFVRELQRANGIR